RKSIRAATPLISSTSPAARRHRPACGTALESEIPEAGAASTAARAHSPGGPVRQDTGGQLTANRAFEARRASPLKRLWAKRDRYSAPSVFPGGVELPRAAGVPGRNASTDFLPMARASRARLPPQLGIGEPSPSQGSSVFHGSPRSDIEALLATTPE